MEIAVIPKQEIDEAIESTELLADLFKAPATSLNAESKKEASKELARISKLLDSKRQEIVRPALDEQKRINNAFKPVIDKLEAMSKGFINQVNEYVRLEQKKERERIAEETRLAAEKLLEGKKPEPIRPMSPNVAVSTTKVWVWEVADYSKVPKEYLTVDFTKVNQAVRSGVRSIPGLKIYQDERVSRR